MNSHSTILFKSFCRRIVSSFVPDGAVDNTVVCEETSAAGAYFAPPHQGCHLCTGGTGHVPERYPGGHQRLQVPSQMMSLPEQPYAWDLPERKSNIHSRVFPLMPYQIVCVELCQMPC